MIGRMTESLIGAVGLKEFVFGTRFLSVSLKDQDSSEAAASPPPSFLSVLPSFPVPSGSLHSSRPRFRRCLSLSVLLFQVLGTLAIFLCPASLLADSRPGPPQNLKGAVGRRGQRAGPRLAETPSRLYVSFGQTMETLWTSVSSSINGQGQTL